MRAPLTSTPTPHSHDKPGRVGLVVPGLGRLVLLLLLLLVVAVVRGVRVLPMPRRHAHDLGVARVSGSASGALVAGHGRRVGLDPLCVAGAPSLVVLLDLVPRGWC